MSFKIERNPKCEKCGIIVVKAFTIVENGKTKEVCSKCKKENFHMFQDMKNVILEMGETNTF